MIVKCVDLEKGSKSQKQKWDKDIGDFDIYMKRLRSYIEFKEANPQSGNYPDLFAYETPVTIGKRGKMEIYQHDKHSSSIKILKKYESKENLQILENNYVPVKKA